MPQDEEREESRSRPSERYSAFAPWQKNCILGLATMTAWFSTISSFIYYPAIPSLAADLGVGIERVNLTVTSYLIASGIVPSVMGDAADRLGRRPVFIAGLAVYLGANVGLALQSSFGLLFFFRMLQSAGISGTYSVTYGVLSDMFTPAERGGYSGIMSFFLNTPPSIGPILSGLLLLRWDWRSIFWFLTAATPCCLVPMLLCFPETARNIVDDGSVLAKGVNRPPIALLCPTPARNPARGFTHDSAKKGFPNPLASLKLLRLPETALILSSFGVNYAIYSCLQASLSTLFLDVYNVSGVVAGVIYIPFGIACALSAFATGFLLDKTYSKTAAECGVLVDKTKAQDLGKFPIERARLRTVKLPVALCAALIVTYGWLLQTRTPMAAPLVMQFLIGLTIQTLQTTLNTLLVDIHNDCPSTAQAACNFVRCELSAAFLAALDALLRRLGPGWTFVFFGSLIFLIVPALFVIEKKGMKWRQTQRSGGIENELALRGTEGVMRGQG